ncbi:hypothetical protein M885DRAFT_618260 [Pelagophyceae sp. CCMP2097]|nr:hypothetical protein M885DRAFT_618260 [Pelagophyceae sp. CCMP2097]
MKLPPKTDSLRNGRWGQATCAPDAAAAGPAARARRQRMAEYLRRETTRVETDLAEEAQKAVQRAADRGNVDAPAKIARGTLAVHGTRTQPRVDGRRGDEDRPRWATAAADGRDFYREDDRDFREDDRDYGRDYAGEYDGAPSTDPYAAAPASAGWQERWATDAAAARSATRVHEFAAESESPGPEYAMRPPDYVWRPLRNERVPPPPPPPSGDDEDGFLRAPRRIRTGEGDVDEAMFEQLFESGALPKSDARGGAPGRYDTEAYDEADRLRAEKAYEEADRLRAENAELKDELLRSQSGLMQQQGELRRMESSLGASAAAALAQSAAALARSAESPLRSGGRGGGGGQRVFAPHEATLARAISARGPRGLAQLEAALEAAAARDGFARARDVYAALEHAGFSPDPVDAGDVRQLCLGLGMDRGGRVDALELLSLIRDIADDVGLEAEEAHHPGHRDSRARASGEQSMRYVEDHPRYVVDRREFEEDDDGYDAPPRRQRHVDNGASLRRSAHEESLRRSAYADAERDDAERDEAERHYLQHRVSQSQGQVRVVRHEEEEDWGLTPAEAEAMFARLHRSEGDLAPFAALARLVPKRCLPRLQLLYEARAHDAVFQLAAALRQALRRGSRTNDVREMAEREPSLFQGARAAFRDVVQRNTAKLRSTADYRFSADHAVDHAVSDKLFDKIDTDGDGKLSRRELLVYLRDSENDWTRQTFTHAPHDKIRYEPLLRALMTPGVVLRRRAPDRARRVARVLAKGLDKDLGGAVAGLRQLHSFLQGIEEQRGLVDWPRLVDVLDDSRYSTKALSTSDMKHLREEFSNPDGGTEWRALLQLVDGALEDAGDEALSKDGLITVLARQHPRQRAIHIAAAVFENCQVVDGRVHEAQVKHFLRMHPPV